MNSMLLMLPAFLVSILGVVLIWTETQPWVAIGYGLISVVFAVIVGLMVFLQTPSQSRLNRRVWNKYTLVEKVKWKLKNGLRRN